MRNIPVQDLSASVSSSRVHTTCPYCGVGCGVTLSRQRNQDMPIGDEDHPANFGRMCVKGSALHETIGVNGRLLHPEVDGKQTDWNSALDRVAQRLQETIEKYGPDAVAFYVSGQLLTEDYYVANKLMKGYIGSANIDTNSRLCMSTAVAAHKRVFGADAVPTSYEDLESAELIILYGSNMAWTHPVVYQRIAAAKAARPELKIVVIDPRRTSTAELADLHLPIKPGTDIELIDGLLAYLINEGHEDSAYLKKHAEDYESVCQQIIERSSNLSDIAETCDISLENLKRFYQWFANTEKTVSVFSQGINQSSRGVDQASLILYSHLLTGRIGQEGSGPFSITGQPNAMGGREVGGLANQLAAHMNIESEAHKEIVQTFWGSPTICQSPGAKAIDMFRQIEEGTIKFVWIMATNPVVSLPEAERVKSALSRCPTVVVSDCMAETDTVRLAHIKLPAAGWGEKDGTVTNSERRISRQRSFLDLPAEVKPDWWIICQVAERLGFASDFNFAKPADIFREHARLSAYKNKGDRAFNIGGMIGMSDMDYDQLKPVQWPVIDRDSDGNFVSTKRLFTDGLFYTPSGKAKFHDVVLDTSPRRQGAFPFMLNTGRIRDQWHTMTRTGLSRRLQKHYSEPFVEMHPDDMKALELQSGQLASVSSPQGSCTVRVSEHDGLRKGDVFMPIHWSDSFASAARTDTLVAAICDPISGQPAFKQTPVEIKSVKVRWQAILLFSIRLPLPGNDYWAYRALGDWHMYILAGNARLDIKQMKKQWRKQCDQWAEVDAGDQAMMRLVGSRQGRPTLWMALHEEMPQWNEDWLLDAIKNPETSMRALLLGMPLGARLNKGSAQICTCNQVDEDRITEAISKGCSTVECVGKKTRAGTTCGSCIPEIRKLLTRVNSDEQEEVLC